ncbi:histidine kinase [Hydrogenoanaerobacterium sp.]|uniref:sensor histidine kinase n=1 Tax=Hydrogenoanaerobacterium sp. TaxID=2953763 RepID=UPI00289F7B79|nr:histidine kinase [Hydrogenoanaerobacterium sp.]
MKKLSIRRLSVRITFYFSVVFIAAFAVLILVITHLFSNKLSAEMNMVVGQKLGLASTTLDHTLSEIRSLHFSLINNQTLQAYMRGQHNGAEEDNLTDLISFKNELNRTGQRTANVRSIVAISSDRRILDPIYAAPPYNQIIDNNPEFERFLLSQLTGRFSAPCTFPMQIKNAQYSDRNTITYFGRYYDGESYEDLGYIAINLTKYSIFNELETLFSNTFAHTYVLDENNSIILQTQPPLVEDLDVLRTEYVQGEVVYLEGRPYAIYGCSLTNYPNWRIVGLMDYHSILSPIAGLYTIIFIVAVLVLVLVVCVSFSISHHITNPIRTLDFAMEEVGHGLLPEVAPLRTIDEISGLINGFNSMVRSLRHLTEVVATEQEEKKKIEVAMVQSQLDLLQSQINPHFIHNTLNTMKYMAKREGAEELAELIVSFNSLLRTSMSTDHMLITMLEEIENLNHYIRIQLERYDVDLDFSCDISESARGVMIPKLILQPLVENSLFHGIVPVGGGKIVVSARTGENRLWITIWDDGAGIPPDKLCLILDGILPNARGYNQIGLANVSERLVLNYGDSSRLVVQSMVGRGTSIGFSIPVKINGPDDICSPD